MCEFSEQIRAVQDYYAEGRPLAERLAWTMERVADVKAEADQAWHDYMDWQQRYQGSLDSPLGLLIAALQQSADYVAPPLDLIYR